MHREGETCLLDNIGVVPINILHLDHVCDIWCLEMFMSYMI